jgi:hypothetical protein
MRPAIYLKTSNVAVNEAFNLAQKVTDLGKNVNIMYIRYCCVKCTEIRAQTRECLTALQCPSYSS